MKNKPTGDPEKFLTTQHERDQETGLDYRGARYYDSDIARFLSLDPLAAEFPSWSAYNYVMGNPISLIDPTGKSPEGNGDKDKKKPGKGKGDDSGGGIFKDIENVIFKTIDGPEIRPSEEQAKKYLSPFEQIEDYDVRKYLFDSQMSQNLGYVSTASSLVGAQLELSGKLKSEELFKLGFRRGLQGNYQLTGSNWSRFRAMPVKPNTLPITWMGRWGKGIGGLGNVAGGVSIGIDTYLYNHGAISGTRYSYHIGSFVTSVGVGMRFGGPAGALVGAASATAEAGYDATKKTAGEMKQSYNRFHNGLVKNWLRF